MIRARVAGTVVFGCWGLVGAIGGRYLDPDTALYLGRVGSSWFYPSVGGRAIGSFGVAALAASNVAACAALGWVVVRLAQSVGAAGWAAPWVVLALPASLYLQPAALDSAGALAVCGAVLLDRRSLGLASLLLHPASGLGFLGWSGWRGGYAAVLTVSAASACGLAGMMLSPYAGIITRAAGSGLVPAAVTLGIFLLPLALLYVAGFAPVRGCAAFGCGVWSAAAATVVVGLQGGIQVRYFLPASVLLGSIVRARP